jgi:predicted DCC family thiol-disulfide oxidoreductase YuxK
MISNIIQKQQNGVLLYDASCGVCNRGVRNLKKFLMKQGIETSPLQEQWVKEKLNLTETELLQDVRLLLNDGTLLEGANVYRYALRKTWWTFPLYLLSELPLLSSLFDWGYRMVAINRNMISKVCS